MKPLRMLVLVLLAFGCGNRQKPEVSAEPTAQSAPVSSPATALGAEVAGLPNPERVSEGGPSRPASALQRILVPPSEAGRARVTLDGCLSLTGAPEEVASRFPAAAEAPRNGSSPAVRVEPLGNGVLVAHELDHNCCTKADVDSTLEGAVVTLTETLSGEACRCRCRSTVRAAVGLKPGEYTLRVITVEGKERRVAHEARLAVH